MLSSLEALDDPPEPKSVPRVGVFQPKAKPRARKPSNNASNASDKIKVNVVAKPPEQPAKVPKLETATVLEELPVSLPASPPEIPDETPVIPSSPPVDNPAEETSVVVVPSIQEPAGAEDSSLLLSALGENPQPEELVPLHTTGSLEHATQDNDDSYAAHGVTHPLPVACPVIQETDSVAEDQKPQTELRRSKRKAVINRHFRSTAGESGEEDEETKVSHLSNKRSKERDQQSENGASEPKFKHKNDARKVAPDSEGTQQEILKDTVPNAENPPEEWGDLANNLDKKKCNQSRSQRKKVSLRKLAHDSTIMQQESLENTGNVSIPNTVNPPEEGVSSVDPDEKNSNQSRCQRQKTRVRKASHDSTIIQQEILENRENLFVSNTENSLAAGLALVSNIDDKHNNKSRHCRKKMKVTKPAHNLPIMEQEILESRENMSVPNTEIPPAEGLAPMDNVDGKNNNQSRQSKQKMKVKRGDRDSTIKEQGFLGYREDVSLPNTEFISAERLAPENDTDDKNINQSRHRKQKVKARKSDQESAILQQELLENREYVSVPNTGNPPGKGVAPPFNEVDNKNNNQSGHRKRKSKSSTDTLRHNDDSNIDVHDTELQLRREPEIVGQSLQHPEVSENATAKQKQKKQASKSGELSLEGSKKRFSHSTRRHRRRVEKHLIDTPEADLDHSKLTMRDIIRLAEAKERRQNKEEAAKKKSRVTETTPHSISKETNKSREEDEGISLAPQVQVINGQIVINEQSLMVSARELNMDDIQTYRRVEESTSKLNYHSYLNKTPVERWSKSDTELFYKAMRQFGADFAMIQHLFPGRTRRQVKAKFKKEERQHPLQLADALIHRSQDHSHYQMLIDRLKISSEPAEHDQLPGRQAGPTSLEDVLIESLDEDHEERGADAHQILTQESVTSEQIHANEKDSTDNCSEHSKRDERNMVSSTHMDLNMKDSDVGEETFPIQENVNNAETSTKPVRSLFSYQTAPSKPVKSLFSYQQA